VIPAAFQTPRVLRIINIGAVGFALAGLVAPLIGYGFSSDGPFQHFSGVGPIGVRGGLPTLLCGLLWAWLLRLPMTVGKKRPIRWGWLASIPLAMLNSGLTAALLLTSARPFELPSFLFTIIFGATFGVFLWGPALLMTLAFFGLPIASAQRLAKKGLAGEERGEVIVGLTCAAMSALGLGISFNVDFHLAPGGSDASILRSFALIGLLAGAAGAGLALARERRRRAFVAAAEAGKIPGYRIEATDEGKVLVRIVAQGKGYRVADFEEEVFELDEAGQARRPVRVDEATPRKHVT
jgi:MFS family permease